jgi:hypothetical protein
LGSGDASGFVVKVAHYWCATNNQLQWSINASRSAPLSISGVTLSNVSISALGYVQQNSTYWIGTLSGSFFSSTLGFTTTGSITFDSINGFTQLYPSYFFPLF